MMEVLLQNMHTTLSDDVCVATKLAHNTHMMDSTTILEMHGPATFTKLFAASASVEIVNNIAVKTLRILWHNLMESCCR